MCVRQSQLRFLPRHPVEHLSGIADADIEADLREPLVEAAQQRRQIVAAHHRRSGEGERARLQQAEILKNLADFVEKAEEAAGVAVEHFALGGERDGAARAVEEGDVQRVFQSLHLLADGGLGEEEQARRAGKTAALRDAVKGFQVFEIHPADRRRQGIHAGLRGGLAA